jgi:hypothetical protein
MCVSVCMCVHTHTYYVPKQFNMTTTRALKMKQKEECNAYTLTDNQISSFLQQRKSPTSIDFTHADTDRYSNIDTQSTRPESVCL